MKRSLLEKYALFVCFFSLICILVSSTALVYGALGMAKPELTMDADKYTRFQSNDDYWGCSPHWVKCERKTADGRVPTEEEITAMRTSELRREIEKEKMSSTQTLIKALLYLLGSGGIFLLHWRLGRRERVQPAGQ